MTDISRPNSNDNTNNVNVKQIIPTSNVIDENKVHLWGHKSPITVDHTSYNNFEHDPDLIVEIDLPYNKFDKHKSSAKHKRVSSAGALSGSGTDRSYRSGSARTPIKSRSRPMKPHEPEPFLAVGAINSGRMSETPTARVPQRPSSMRKGRAPTVSGRLYVPDGRSPSPYINSGRNTPASSIFVSPSTKQPQKPNVHIRSPFKHSVQKTEESKDRPSSPAQDMKELTAFATFQVGKMLAREPAEPKAKIHGRLLKGKLKPLNTVHVKGPTIEKCKGIVSDSRGSMPAPNRTLARRREILERIPNVHEFLYDRPRTEESIHRTSRASSVDENRENMMKDEHLDQDETPISNQQTMQSDSLLMAPTGSQMSDVGPSGPTPTPRMFVTEISGKGKENVPTNGMQIELQEKSERSGKSRQEEDGKPERPSTAGKLVRFAENAKTDDTNSKDVKQRENAKIAESLRESTVASEDTQMEMQLKINITIVEKAQQEDVEVLKTDIKITEVENKRDGKKSKQTCRPDDIATMKKDENDDDDNLQDKDNKFIENSKASNISKSQNVGQPSYNTESKGSPDKNGKGKQNSHHMCRSKDRYKAPSTLQIQSVLHDGNVYYTVGAESPRRSPSPHSRSSSPASSLRRSSGGSSKSDIAKNKSNRLIRPSSANQMKQQRRRFSHSSDSNVSSASHQKSDSSENYTSRKSKVYFEGENPPRQSIFTENKKNSEVEIALKNDKPLTFDDIEGELMAIQESIRNKREKTVTDTVSADLDLNDTLDTVDMELQRQIEEKIINLELNSKCQQTTTESCDTPKENVNGYLELLEMYRTKCMTVSENCGYISSALTTPRTNTPTLKRKSSLTRPQSGLRKGTSPTKTCRRHSFHFEKSATSNKENSTNNHESGKELFRTPSVVSMATDSGYSFGLETEGSKVPSVNGWESDVCLTDGEEEEKPLLEMVCDHLPEKEVSVDTTINGRIVNEEAGVDFQIVAKAKEFSKHKSANKHENKKPVAPFAPLCFTVNARPPSGYLYYFAYGPDMNPSRVSAYLKRDVTSRFWGLLFGFQLVFNKKGLDIEAGGFSNIEFNPFCSVEGVIYQITPEELQLLDNHVGYPEHYTHLMLPVWMSNSLSPDQYGVAQYCVPAVMYIAQDKWLNKDETINCDYALQQCIKSSDLVTPDYRDHMVNYCQPISEQVVCV